MGTSADVAKKSLGTATMHVSRNHSNGTLISSSAFWRIRNFNMIKDNTNYTSFYEPEGWTFSLHKKRRVLTVTVDMKKEHLLLKCGVDGSKTTGGNFATCLKKSTGIYERKFETKDYAESPLMKKGTLMLEFEFSDVYAKSCASTSKKSTVDLQHISDDLLNVFSGLIGYVSYADFELRVGNQAFPVHKSILAARSTYFSEHFRKYPDSKELKITISYYILCRIISFIYTGEVQLKEIWFRTQSLFESAVQLGVTRLSFIITVHLLETINEENVNEIRELGLKNGVKILVKAADNFLERDSALGIFRGI